MCNFHYYPFATLATTAEDWRVNTQKPFSLNEMLSLRGPLGKWSGRFYSNPRPPGVDSRGVRHWV